MRPKDVAPTFTIFLGLIWPVPLTTEVKSWRATTQEREGKAKAAFRSKPWGLMALALALGVGAGLVARAIQRQRAKGCAGEPNGLAKERSSGRARFLQ